MAAIWPLADNEEASDVDKLLCCQLERLLCPAEHSSEHLERHDRTALDGSEDMLHSIRSDVVVRSMSGGKLCIGKDVCCYPHFTDSSPTRETALLWS